MPLKSIAKLPLTFTCSKISSFVFGNYRERVTTKAKVFKAARRI